MANIKRVDAHEANVRFESDDDKMLNNFIMLPASVLLFFSKFSQSFPSLPPGSLKAAAPTAVSDENLSRLSRYLKLIARCDSISARFYFSLL